MAKLTPTFRAAGSPVFSADSVANPTSLAVVAPASRQAGDLLVLITESRSRTATVATPSGWTLASTYPIASGTASGGKMYVFRRTANGGGSDSPTITWTGVTTGTSGDSCGARILAFYNARNTQDGSSGVDGGGFTDTAAINWTIPTHTTSVDGSLVVGFGMHIHDTARTFTVTNYTERSDDHTTTGTGHGTLTGSQVKATAGLVSSATISPSPANSARVLAAVVAFQAKEEWSSGAASVTSGTEVTVSGAGVDSGAGATGAADLTGSGTLSASGFYADVGEASLTGSGSLSATGDYYDVGSANLTGSGSLSVAGTFSYSGSADLSGSGSLSAGGAILYLGAASLAGTGTLAATGYDITIGTALIGGGGTLSASGYYTAVGAAALTGAGLLTVSYAAYIPVAQWWDGDSWEPANSYVYEGGSWKLAQMRRYEAGTWVPSP